MIALLYLLFFLSGAAGLMYESVWTRYLGLFAGHQAYAQILVLVIFLGGMSLGAAWISRRAARVADPLRNYAMIECIVGLIGLAFHPVFVVATGWAYDHLFPAIAGGPLFTVAKWGLASLLILPQSILLGTTFPLMSGGILRRAPEQPGQVLSWLYFTNSLGAAIGVLVAGFVLVDHVGLPGVLATAGILNLVVGAGAFAVAWWHKTGVSPADSGNDTAGSGPSNRTERLLLGAAFFTAIASFCYEIDWIRMLSLVLGSATRSFELMLSAFILGLALGAFWIRRRSDWNGDPLRLLAVIQVVMGLLAIATLPLYLASFGGMEWLLGAVAHNDQGYAIYIVARYVLCLGVMLPATCCAGMTLPVITSTLVARERGEAAIGRVYAVNTLGSIIGVALAGLLLLPLLGLKWLLIAGGVVDIAVGLVLLHAGGRSRWVWRTAAGAAAVIAVVVVTARFNRLILTAGVFRGHGLDYLDGYSMPYYADGRTATVSVTKSTTGFLSIATNGKVDASVSRESELPCDSSGPRRGLGSDEITQVLTGLLPLAYATHGGEAAVFGIGSGTSSHMVLADAAFRGVTTIEIEPRMVDGARLFQPVNHRTFDDPRSHIIVDDAKAYFAASGRRWDLIVSEPSNPWVKGVSGLFTEEFYRRIRSHLAAGGVFAQWLQAYELNDDLVLSVLAALSRVFPDWRVLQVGSADLLFIASGSGALPPADWNRVAHLPALRQDFCSIVPADAAAFEATLIADRALLLPVVERIAKPNSDFYPVLDLQAERRRFEGGSADGLLTLGDDWFNLARELTGARQTPVVTTALAFAELRRGLARLSQTWQTREPPPDSALTSTVSQSRFEWSRWNALLGDDRAPSDWHGWLADFIAVDTVRHDGTAGWIDSTFYRQSEAFAVRHNAPAGVRAVLAFRRGVQSWDATAALAAARELDLPENAGWIDAQQLGDGAVVAAIRLGDGALAVQWWESTARGAGRPADDPRSRILAAWVAATMGGHPAAGAAGNPRERRRRNRAPARTSLSANQSRRSRGRHA